MRSLLLLVVPTLVTALPAPTTAPFVHPRGLTSPPSSCSGNTISPLDYGAVSGPDGDAGTNLGAFNKALAALAPCDTFVVPAGTEFTLVGGIEAENLMNNTIIFDGSLSFEFDEDVWPTNSDSDDKFKHCINIWNAQDLVISGSGSGIINGNGRPWWDKMIAGTLPGSGDTRPKLFNVANSVDVLIENIHLVNSPSWNLIVNAARCEIRNIEVTTDRDYQRELKSSKVLEESAKDKVKEWLVDELSGLLPDFLLEPEDLNTDGIDPSGVDFYIHDVKIYNDDDSIAVKPVSAGGQTFIDGTETDCSRNMLLENMELVGFGASIGSVPPNEKKKCVDAITMRNVSMPGTGKGIYVKSNGNDCLNGKTSSLTNLLFEDFVITDPFWYAVWIGPQQQQEPGSELGLDCALQYPLAGSQCPTQGCSDFENITLKNVLIENPKLSPGAIMGNSTNPMRNIVFDNVVVKHDKGWASDLVAGRWPWRESSFPFKGTYKSMHVEGTCRNCDPVPEGFVEV